MAKPAVLWDCLWTLRAIKLPKLPFLRLEGYRLDLGSKAGLGGTGRQCADM